MSNQAIQFRNEEPPQAMWAQALEELDAEIAASQQLTEAEKRYLLEEMDQLSDDEWEPIVIEGEPLSVTIINDRGKRLGVTYVITANSNHDGRSHRPAGDC